VFAVLVIFRLNGDVDRGVLHAEVGAVSVMVEQELANLEASPLFTLEEISQVRTLMSQVREDALYQQLQTALARSWPNLWRIRFLLMVLTITGVLMWNVFASGETKLSWFFDLDSL
jgi:hypothetical protein